MKNTIISTLVLPLVLTCSNLWMKAQPLPFHQTQFEEKASEQSSLDRNWGDLKNMLYYLVDLELEQLRLEHLYLERTPFQQVELIELGLDWEHGMLHLPDSNLYEGKWEAGRQLSEAMEALYFQMLDLEVEMMDLGKELKELSTEDEVNGRRMVEPWLEVDGSIVTLCAYGLERVENEEEERIWREVLALAQSLKNLEGKVVQLNAAVQVRRGIAGEISMGEDISKI